jgi:hypothetical protein
MTAKEALELAKQYGYHENMRSSSGNWFGLHHDNLPIHLDLYPETERFMLTTMHGIVKITTDECGSFSNMVHFLGMQRKIIEVIEKL